MGILKVAKAFDHQTGKDFIITSEENNLFFENRRRGMNQCAYEVYFNVIYTAKENKEAVVEALKKASSLKEVTKVYLDFDNSYR